MKKHCTIFLTAVLTVLASCVKTVDKPLLFTQIPFEYYNDETRSTYLEELQEADVDFVLMSVCEFFPKEDERAGALARLSEAIGYFSEAGFKVGVWTNTLGYGYPRPVLDTLCPGHRDLVSFEGKTHDAICSTDKAFMTMMKRNVRDFAKAGARFILLDDDLVQCVRPGFGCVCEEHIRLLEEKTGEIYTPEQCRDFFTGAPSPERAAFLAVMGESMSDFCEALRRAVDEVDPDIEMGICSSYTHFDAEGVDMEKLSRLLAGKGKTPFLRISGATYWPVIAPRNPGQSIADVIDFARMQIGWYRDRDIELFDENDPYPRKSDVVDPGLCEIYDKAMIANGGIHRHKYMLCYEPQNKDAAYLEAHLDNMSSDEKLLQLFAGKLPFGFRVLESEHRLRAMELPDIYPGDSQMMSLASHSAASVFLTANSIPVCFEGEVGPAIVFGSQAAGLELDGKFEGILDVPAAKALMDKGIDVGLLLCEKCSIPKKAVFSKIFNKETVKTKVSSGSFYKLVPRSDVKAEVLSTFDCDGETIPACLRLETEDGIFFVYAWDAWSLLESGNATDLFWHSDAQRKELAEIYASLSGSSIPVPCKGIEGLYLIASKGSLLVCNITGHEAINASINIPDGWKLRSSLKSVANQEDNVIRIESIPALDWCALRFKVK